MSTNILVKIGMETHLVAVRPTRVVGLDFDICAAVSNPNRV